MPHPVIKIHHSAIGAIMRFLNLVILSAFSTLYMPAQDIFSLHEQGEGPSRPFHVSHYKIEVNLDEQAKTVDGKMTATIVPLVADLRSIQLNAGKMSIRKVIVDGKHDLRFDYDS